MSDIGNDWSKENDSVCEVFLQGDVGRIHGKYYKSKNKTDPVVLLLPPGDASSGATMDNRIIKRIFNVFVDSGFTALRINLRGSGKSEGDYSDETGILIDLSLTINWLQNQNPDASHFWIAGYSDVWKVANIMMRRPEIEGFVLISPKVKGFDFSFLSPCLTSGLIVHGNVDKNASIADSKELHEFMNENDKYGSEFKIVEGADHFYGTKDSELALCLAVQEYINVRLATRIEKPIRKKRRRRKKRNSVI